ncbi:MAG: hypothetical protein KQI35_05260 [Bacteroidetes bacterium]|nr:hypothetical protein [Bacteroidota bacterium]
MITFRSLKHLFVGFYMLFLWQGLFAQDTISVMYYNVLNFPGTTPSRVDYFRTIAQYTLPDVMLLTEVSSEDGANLLLNEGLNVGSIDAYEKADFTDGPDTDNMLFFNGDKLGLKAQNTISTQLRFINEYVLFYKSNNLSGGGDTIFMRFYVAHLKASTGSDNEQQRLAEIMAFEQYLEDNEITENIVFGGDLNFYGSDEPAYQYIVDPDNIGLIDPLPAGDWHNNPAFATIHTQSTRTAQFGGGASGGCDDRFDFIFYSDDVVNGNQTLQYIPGSSYALANDGQHFNVSILDPPVNTTVPDSVLTALYYMADHLPVMSSLSVQPLPEPVTETLDVKVFLEGPFNGSDMNSDLSPFIPVNQPFNETPWFYPGNESIEESMINVVDWCLLELRVTQGTIMDALNDTAVWRKACLILENGSIRDTDLLSLPAFDDIYTGNKYLIIRHRNHLDILTSTPLEIINDTYDIDFTTSSSTVYGGTLGYSQLSNGAWGMTSGDIDGNGTINFLDLQNVWRTQTGYSGFLDGDADLNGNVNNVDKNTYILPNLFMHTPFSE